MEDEYTGKETERQDCVDNAIFDLLYNLAPDGKREKMEWDIEKIGKVRDAIHEVLVDDLKFMTEQEFYPYREL